MNLHARVAAVAAAYLLAGQQLRWLKGLDADTPTEILFETDGPGDDLRFILASGLVVEAQVKKGLTRGNDLWQALELLARGIDQNSIRYGVLVVDQDASSTIRRGLACGIVRLGDGRTDALDDITTEFKQRLEKFGLCVQEICSRLRIVVVHCSDSDDATERDARSLLLRVCATDGDAKIAWSNIELTAHGMIERKGRWTAESHGGILRSAGAQVRVEVDVSLPAIVSGLVWEQLDDLSPQRGLIQRFRQHYLQSDRMAATVFGGRDDECERLDAWLYDSAMPSRMLVCGPTARGKSALLVQWTEKLAADTAWAVVFVPISLRFSTNRPSVFYELLAIQLARLLQINLSEPSFDRSEYYRAKSTVFLNRAAREGRHVLIVVDGLDEAEGASFDPAVFIPSPPPNVKILVSARELAGDHGAKGWLQRLDWQGSTRAAKEELAVLDRNAVTPILASAGLSADVVTDALIDRLMVLSGGEPLLLALYAEDLSEVVRAGGTVGLTTLEGLTPGFSDYFARSFDVQRNPSEDQEVVDATLAILAMALGPMEGPHLTDLVCSVTGRPRPFAVGHFIRPIERFVAGSGRSDHGYVLNHPKLGEYLREERFDSIRLKNVEQQHRNWCRAIATSCEADPHSAVPTYAIRYHVSHLCKELPVALDDVEPLLSDSWRQGWFQLDLDYVGYADTLLAVSAAMQSSESYGKESPRALRLKIKIALCIGSVKSQSSTIPAELMAMAIQEQLMTLQQALNIIELQQPTNKLTYLLAIVESLSTDAVKSLLFQILQLENVDARQDQLARLMPYLPASTRTAHLEQLLEWLAASENLQVSAIAALAPILDDSQLEAIVGRVISSRLDESSSLSAVIALAPVLDILHTRGKVQLEQLLAGTFMSWIESANDSLRAVDALAAMAGGRVELDRMSAQVNRLKQLTQSAAVQSPNAGWDVESEVRKANLVGASVKLNVLEINGISDLDDSKLRLTAALAPVLVPDFWQVYSLVASVALVRDDLRQNVVDKAFQLSLGLPSANNRTHAMMQLAKNAHPPLRRTIVARALVDARRVEDGYLCAQTLVALFSNLAPADRERQHSALYRDILKAGYLLDVGELLVQLSGLVVEGETLANQGFQLMQFVPDSYNSTRKLLQSIGRASRDNRHALFSECWRRICTQWGDIALWQMGLSARYAGEYWTERELGEVRRRLATSSSSFRLMVLSDVCPVADRFGAADFTNEAIQAIESERDPNSALAYSVRLLADLPKKEECRNLLRRKWHLAAGSEKPHFSALIDGFEVMDSTEQSAVWTKLVTCAMNVPECIPLARLALMAKEGETSKRLMDASFSSLEAATADERIQQGAQLVSMLPDGVLRWKALDLMTSKPSVSRATILSAVRVSAPALAEIGTMPLTKAVMEDVRQCAAWWP
jgi:hypothetical protein